MPSYGDMVRRQKALGDFGEFALRSDDLDEVLTQACRIVADVLGTGRAKVLEIQQDGHSLLVRAGIGWEPHIVGKLRLPMRVASSETFAIKEGRPVIMGDLRHESRFDIPDFMKDAGVLALANVPILLPHGRAYGLLQVDATQPRDFGDEDTEFLRTYATILGPVIDRLLHLRVSQWAEERFRLIVASTRDYAIFLTDAEDRITDWLPGAEAVYGYSVADATGQPAAMLFTAEDREGGEPQRETETARREGAAPNVHRHLRKDGRRVSIDGAVSALYDADGAVRGFLKIGQDVTARRAAEAALRESEALHRLLIESWAQAVWEVDADGVVLADSPTWRRYTGQTFEEWLGYGWLNAIHPDDRAYAERHWRDAIAARTLVDAEFRLCTPHGGWRWTNVRAAPVYGAGGQIEKWVGMNFDIDARKRAETALRDSEQRLALAFRTLPVGIAVLDNSGEVVMANDVIRRFLPPGRIPSQNPNHVVRWRGWDSHGRLVQPADFPGTRALRGETVSPGMQMLYRDETGTEIWTEVLSTPLTDGHGHVTGAIAVVVDVDRVKRSEERAQESEGRLRALIEGVSHMVWRAVAGGNWMWASPQWTAFTGQAEADSHDLGWLDPVHPDDRPVAASAWARAEGAGGVEAEYRIRNAATGQYRWFQTRAVPRRGPQGEVVEWLGTSTDVHQLKALQESQAVMVAELQHRTRNLITVVRSIAEDTMEQTGPTEAFRSAFDHRLTALSRVQGLLSRAEVEPITIAAVVRLELDALGAGASRERVTVAGPDVWLKTSTVQTLALALHELATNARKYGALSHERGRLAVTWSERSEGGERRLVLEWHETGFEHTPNTVQPAFEGRGYGRELIEQALPHALGARTSYTLDETGVRCTIDLLARQDPQAGRTP